MTSISSSPRMLVCMAWEDESTVVPAITRFMKYHNAVAPSTIIDLFVCGDRVITIPPTAVTGHISVMSVVNDCIDFPFKCMEFMRNRKMHRETELVDNTPRGSYITCFFVHCDSFTSCPNTYRKPLDGVIYTHGGSADVIGVKTIQRIPIGIFYASSSTFNVIAMHYKYEMYNRFLAYLGVEHLNPKPPTETLIGYSFHYYLTRASLINEST